jgi:beta-lactamase class A
METPMPSTCADLDGVVQAFAELPGRAAFQVRRLDKDARVLAAHQADVPLAIGTGAVLFVLAALTADIAAGRRKWADVVTLQERWKSLPPGLLQDWPAGAPVTLHTLATLAVGHADQTAADHLLLTLGREAIAKDQPFLATREYQLIKHGPDLESFLAKDALGRTAYLAAGNITQQKLAALQPGPEPRAVGQLGWFASAAELVDLLDAFRATTEAGEAARARRVLGTAAGPSQPDKDSWPFVGFKGGSEPGLISLNYLLRSAKGGWYALSATWNDEAPLDQARFSGLVARAIELTAAAAR